MMRVTLYIPDFSAGGAERVAVNLAAALVDAGVRVTLLVNRRKGPLAAAVAPGIAVVELGANRTLAAVPGLLRFLWRERPDVLISSLSFNNMIAIWCNRVLLRPTKIVASLHNTLTRQSTAMPSLRDRLVPALYKFTLPLADHVVTVSHGVAEDLRASLRRLPPISVIHNPIVSPNMLAEARAPLDHPWFAAGQPPLVLGVGRMVAQKNFALLIDAFARLCAQRPVRLAILGDGPLRGRLSAQIDALGLGAQAILLPTDPNPWRYMARAAVVALSSDYEGFGNVLVEAMATGVPVVSTNCPHGPAEILGDGKWGLLVDDATPERLADAIARTLDDPPADAAALRARAMAFSAAAAADAYRALAEDLCGVAVAA
jgi:glycosyltransferase involved in cell wall biosynthesis